MYIYSKISIIVYNLYISHGERSKRYTVELDTNAHSVFSLHYHLVLIIKYRRRAIDDAINKRLKEIYLYIAPNYNITVVEWNYCADHLHILYKGHPNTEHTKFINAYKSASSRLIKKEFPTVREKLWKEYFWSRSFCLLTTGGVSIEIIKEYIQSQGERNEQSV